MIKLGNLVEVIGGKYNGKRGKVVGLDQDNILVMVKSKSLDKYENPIWFDEEELEILK